jgi:hypothetical protein
MRSKNNGKEKKDCGGGKTFQRAKVKWKKSRAGFLLYKGIIQG